MGCFQLHRDEQGNHCFRLHTLAGSVVLRSAPYTNPHDARDAIAAVRMGAGYDECFVRTNGGTGWSFRLKANGRVVATGPEYPTAQDRESAIAHVMRAAPDADVFDLDDADTAEAGKACGCGA